MRHAREPAAHIAPRHESSRIVHIHHPSRLDLFLMPRGRACPRRTPPMASLPLTRRQSLLGGGGHCKEVVNNFTRGAREARHAPIARENELLVALLREILTVREHSPGTAACSRS